MRPRIVFVVMSAVAPPAIVDQLAGSLSPHEVLVHHDFSQVPDFRLQAPNVRFVPDPRRTGWATYGFVQGIFHSLDYATRHLEFDYLQLLSPTCLPIKPMHEFEAHVAGPAEAHFGAVDLLNDLDCLMTIGYRAFTPANTFRQRVVGRLSREYFGNSDQRRDEAGIALRSGGGVGPKAHLARWTVKAFSRAFVGARPFVAPVQPYFGSVWFGARPHIVRGMVERFRQMEAHDYFSRIEIAEEFLVPTLLMELTRCRGPLNHYIKRFEKAHPGWIDEQDIRALESSPAFFARKFPQDPAAPVRQHFLAKTAAAATLPRGARLHQGATNGEHLPQAGSEVRASV